MINWKNTGNMFHIWKDILVAAFYASPPITSHKYPVCSFI